MNSLFERASAFLFPRQVPTDEEEEEGGGGGGGGGGGRSRHRPPRPTCPPPSSPYDPTRRTSLTDDSITLYAWPSRGGVVVLERADAIDFAFLGLDSLDPPLRRLRDQDAEDALCQRLLLLGAKWWDSEARFMFVNCLSVFDSRAINDLEYDRAPHPTMRERRWVKVGWPSAPPGGVWVAEFDTNMVGIEEDNLVPLDAGRVMLARNMDERCELLKRIGARFFASLEEYEGHAFLRAWEEKVEGEVGPLVKTSFVESPVSV